MKSRPIRSTSTFLLAGLCAFGLAQRLGAQIAVTVATGDTGSSPLALKSSGWAASQLDLSLTVSQPGQGLLQLTGISKVGKSSDDPYHRNSFWVNLTMRNDTDRRLRGIELELQPLTGPNSPLDGLSFGALSLKKAQDVASRKYGAVGSLDASSVQTAFPNNFWGFSGDVCDGDVTTSPLEVSFPIRGRETAPLRFHSFEAMGAEIEPGEDIVLHFLVSQNGPANSAYLQFTLTEAQVIPEPGQVGLVSAGLLGALALWRILKRRLREGQP